LEARLKDQMASYAEPNIDSGRSLDRGATLLSDPPTSEKRVELWREFNELGAKEIRRRIDLKGYDDDTSDLAREWLSHREFLHFDDGIRALEQHVQQAKSIARDSNLVAHDAASVAQRSNSFARTANEIAAAATKEARISTTIAILALIVAATAMAIAIAIVGKVAGISPSDFVKI
jgi:hypothetical protein